MNKKIQQDNKNLDASMKYLKMQLNAINKLVNELRAENFYKDYPKKKLKKDNE